MLPIKTCTFSRLTKIMLLVCISFGLYKPAMAQPALAHNLVLDTLPKRWDEAMPLGNGMLGALVWQSKDKLRISLDRADLWDNRPAMDLSKLSFKFIQQQLAKNQYDTIHKLGDEPYDNIAYPTKLPGGALEFNLNNLGIVKKQTLDIAAAKSLIEFTNGASFTCYVHAIKNIGHFTIKNFKATDFLPELIVPDYAGEHQKKNDNSHSGEGLKVLGYKNGSVEKSNNQIRYHQPTYAGHYYEILVSWKKMPGNIIEGEWTISNEQKANLPAVESNAAFATDWKTHVGWWTKYWAQSTVSLPDKIIEKQYYLDMYKLGCVARKGAPAITLQAIWTADNGSLPPWKGDFHHDLNTQLSYWPSYTGNHLQEAATFTDWLWKVKAVNRDYTKRFFGVDGLAVPGVSTITGDAMGGWVQYSMSPSVSSWLAQHFYWQWKYSMDTVFLSQRAYPYLHEVATFIEQVSEVENGKRKVAVSSSPEFYDNSEKAWFLNMTNYDLALYRFALAAAAEAASAMGKNAEAVHWKSVMAELPELDTNETGLTIAPGENVTVSHRHLSQAMAIYPMCLLDVYDSAQKQIINNTMHTIETNGTREWCGYSFAWMASMYARAKQADSAVKKLQIFASNFCSPNSFHLNGDQRGGEYSAFTYRPFTLEGNFAFAQGVHELLLQSRVNFIEVFPAVPENWQHVSFNNLRAEGAFIVSAKKINGVAQTVSILAEKGGELRIKLPFKNWQVKGFAAMDVHTNESGILRLITKKGQLVVFENSAQ